MYVPPHYHIPSFSIIPDITTTIIFSDLVEFRFRDGAKLFTEKRFSEFRNLYQQAKEANEELCDFTFPAKVREVTGQVKEERQTSFDEMMKQILAMAPLVLNEWIVDAVEDPASFETRKRRASTTSRTASNEEAPTGDAAAATRSHTHVPLLAQ